MSHNESAPIRNYVRLNLTSSSSKPSSNDSCVNEDNADLKAKIRDHERAMRDLRAELDTAEAQRQLVEAKCRGLEEQLIRERRESEERRSEILRSQSFEQRLDRSLLEIERLNKELEQERSLKRNNEPVSGVSRGSNKEGGEDVQRLETRIQELEQEQERLTNALSEAEQKNASLIAENTRLNEKLSSVQNSREELTPVIAPPPPPPAPPPPPPPLSTIQPFQTLRKSASCSDVSGKKEEKPREKTYEQAMEEMMSKIKAGKALRSVSTKQLSTLNDEDVPEKENNLLQAMGTLRSRKSSCAGRLGDDLRPPPPRSLRFCSPQQLPDEERVEPILPLPSISLTPCKENIDPANHCTTLKSRDIKQATPLVRNWGTNKSTSQAASIKEVPPLVNNWSSNVSINSRGVSPMKEESPLVGNINKLFTSQRESPKNEASPLVGNWVTNTSMSARDTPTVNKAQTLADNWVSNMPVTARNTPTINKAQPLLDNRGTNMPIIARDTPTVKDSSAIVVSEAPRKQIKLKTVEPKVLVWEGTQPPTQPAYPGPSSQPPSHALPPVYPSPSSQPSMHTLPPAYPSPRAERRSESPAVIEAGGTQRASATPQTQLSSELQQMFRQRGLSTRRDK